MVQEIMIPNHTPKSLNELFAMNHWSRARYKKEVEELVYWACKEQRIEPVQPPIQIHYSITFTKQRHRDIDNYVGKMHTDALRTAGIIPDDHAGVVTAVTVSFTIGDEPRTRITLYGTYGETE